MVNFQVPETAQKMMQYDMIQQYTDLPEFPLYRTNLLRLFLHSGNPVLTKEAELFSLATSLVQLALDTHDMVEQANGEENYKQKRSKQLRVLAGDYFSSRFYHLLSQAGQIELVKRLSAAICKVNTMKMNLYEKMQQFRLTAEEYFHHTVNIKSELFLCFANLLHGVYRKHWPDILNRITKCEVIADEIRRMNTVSRFSKSWAFWFLLQSGTSEEKSMLINDAVGCEQEIRAMLNKYNASVLLHKMLETELQKIIQEVRQYASESLMNDLLRLIDPFFHLLPASKS
jgi:heptaprenyl diphosphate synthase